MDINYQLLLILAPGLLLILWLIVRLCRIREQISLIQSALEDIKKGNLNRRVLSQENDVTRRICNDINEIAINSQTRLIQKNKAEQAYKRLMTSLSHDVKTPLASLIGYLEAIEGRLVAGEEKDAYIRIACDKAHLLGNFVTELFEWIKLDAGEQIFHFALLDINELSRNIIAEWIPLFESAGMDYDIEIPGEEAHFWVDQNAYTRILNNLLQNIIAHSEADRVKICITSDIQQARIMVADNGKGISADDLPHIFERMYQCDHSRSARGNGLGLSIARELVSAHKGTITAAGAPGSGTVFTFMLPKGASR